MLKTLIIIIIIIEDKNCEWKGTKSRTEKKE